jgi:putative hemolysin
MANPASVYCMQQGGKLEIRSDARGGQTGYCIFADGSECEEWAYLRGGCKPGAQPTGQVGMANPASVYCTKQGGKLEIRSDAQGGQTGHCIFADGSQCEEWAYFRGECKPGSPAAAVYTNPVYGYSLLLPPGWSVEEKDAQRVILRNEGYELFLGVQRPGEGPETFRTGMPSGEFVEGGTFTLLGKPQSKRLLVLEGKTKLVDYGSHLEAGPLLLSAWLEYRGPAEYPAVDLPAALIAQAEAILASFELK